MPRTRKQTNLSGDVIKWDFTPDEKKEWEREQAKKKRLADMKKTTFSYLPLPEGAEPVAVSDIKTGDFIVQKDHRYCIFRYYRIGKINPSTNKISYVECDENGIELLLNNARSQTRVRDWESDDKDGGNFGRMPKPGKVAKSKITGTETIQGITINIFDHADENAKRGLLGFTKNHYDYYRIVGYGWGYTKVKNPLNPDSSDKDIEKELNKFMGLAIDCKQYSNLYLDNPWSAEAGKNLRQMLKVWFPGTVFNVSTSSYHGCYVSYKDGPALNRVRKLTDQFEEAYESDPYGDYGSFRDTAFTAIFGGFHNVSTERELSKEYKDKILSFVPELKNGGEPEKYGLNFDKIKKGLKDNFGYAPKNWDEIAPHRSYITIDALLANVDLGKTAADQAPKKRPQTTPTEKLIAKAIGGGNIFLPFDGVYGLCKKDKVYGYSKIYHSQYSVTKTVKQKLEAIGLKISDKRVRGFSIVVSNYDEFKRRIEREREELGIPTPPSQEAYARLRYTRYRLSTRNGNIRYDMERKKKYQR